MRLTTARYFTPSGRSIQAKGVAPDIVVEPSKVESLLPKGAYIKESDLHGALDNDKKKTTKDKAKNDKDAKSKDATDKKVDDYQLMRAVDLLRGLSLYNKPVSQHIEEIVNGTAAVTAPEKE